MKKTWYAARVMTGKEYEVREELRKTYKDYEVYVPRTLVTEYIKGKIEQRTEKMLPGYLLISAPSGTPTSFLKADYLEVIGTVTPEELRHLREQEIDEDGTIVVGKRIIIIDGPFAGCKGKVLERDLIAKTAICRLVFQGMDLEVNMRQDYINTIR